MRQISVVSCYVPLLWTGFLDREEEECTELHNPISTEGAGDSGQVLARLELPEPKLLEDIDLPLEKLSTKKGTSCGIPVAFLQDRKI